MATVTANRKKTRPPKKRVRASHAAASTKKTEPRAFQAKIETKTADNKGRVVLGGRFANRAVIIEELNETEVIIKLARIIPEREVWLYENPEALAAVRAGLAQARAGLYNRQGPDVEADAKFAAELED